MVVSSVQSCLAVVEASRRVGETHHSLVGQTALAVWYHMVCSPVSHGLTVASHSWDLLVYGRNG